MQTIYIALLAAPVGFFGSLLGVGGGTFLVPAMVLGLDVDPLSAMPISLTCTLMTALSGIINSPLNPGLIKRCLIFQPAALLGVGIFAPLTHVLEIRYLLIGFSIFMLAIVLVAQLKKANFSFADRGKNTFFLALATFIAGGCSGLFGVGGGIILIPLLRIFTNIPTKEAIHYSLFTIMSSSIIGIVIHSYFQEIPWGSGVAVALVSIPAGMLGAQARNRISEDAINKVFVVFAVAVAVATLFKALSY